MSFKKRKSGIWAYFDDNNEKEKGTVLCRLCKKVCKNSGTTTCLWNHLRDKHQISKEIAAKDAEHPDEKKPKVQQSITKYSKAEQGLYYEIARLTACDFLTFNQVAKSSFIQRGFVALGYKNVKSPNTITKYMSEFAAEKRAELIKELDELKKDGSRFSFVSDEMTKMNRHFMNITLRTVIKDERCKLQSREKNWNLGVLRIRGSFPANLIIDAMKNFLKRFNLDLDKDIVGTTFDGASVMKKTGKDIKPENQICQVHGIHLGMLLVCTYMWIKVYITFMCKLQVYKMLSLRKEKNKMLKKKMRLTLTLTLTWMMTKGCL